MSADTVGTTLTCAATSAGGTTTKAVTVKRDATPPDLTCAIRDVRRRRRPGPRSRQPSRMSRPAPRSAPASAGVSTTSAGRGTATLTGRDKAGNTRDGLVFVPRRLSTVGPASGGGDDLQAWHRPISVQFKLMDARGAHDHGLAGSRRRGGLPGSGGVQRRCATSPDCARYDDRSDTFLFDLKTAKTSTPATLRHRRAGDEGGGHPRERVDHGRYPQLQKSSGGPPTAVAATSPIRSMVCASYGAGIRTMTVSKPRSR